MSGAMLISWGADEKHSHDNKFGGPQFGERFSPAPVPESHEQCEGAATKLRMLTLCLWRSQQIAFPSWQSTGKLVGGLVVPNFRLPFSFGSLSPFTLRVASVHHPSMTHEHESMLREAASKLRVFLQAIHGCNLVLHRFTGGAKERSALLREYRKCQFKRDSSNG